MTGDCPSRRRVPYPTMRTFDALCADLRVTSDERRKLAYHLGAMRMRNTVEKLLGDSEKVR
jgi:hypothetical protein